MSARLIGGALLLTVVAGTVLAGANRSTQSTSSEDHIAWVTAALKRMQTIKPGMTRKELLAVFTTEGGISTPLQRTFVSRDCLYFKVDVTFEAVGRPSRDNNGRVTMVEGEQDRITTISRPYLQFSIID